MAISERLVWQTLGEVTVECIRQAAYRPDHVGLPMGHGGIWQRGAFDAVEGGTAVQPSAVLDDYSAYLVHNVREQGDLQEAGEWYDLLRRSL